MYLRMLCQFLRRPRSVITYTILSFILFIVWLLMTDTHHEKWYENEAPCQISDGQRNDMIELAFRMKEVLDQVQVSHFLCFGTLWGAVRINAILPWDNNIDMCALDEDISRVDEAYLYQSFRRAGVSLSYDSRHGIYNLFFKSATGHLTIFQHFYEEIQRVGWEIRIFPFMYKYQHNFPERLIDKPLPYKRFHGADFAVPQEDFELLKYLYPDDWWKEVKPRGCT